MLFRSVFSRIICKYTALCRERGSEANLEGFLAYLDEHGYINDNKATKDFVKELFEE